VWDPVVSPGFYSLRSSGHASQRVAFSPDGRQLVSTGTAGDWQTGVAFTLWDPLTGQELLSLRGVASRSQVAFSADGRRLATPGAQGTINLWDATTGKRVRTLRSKGGQVLAVAFSPVGQRLASVGRGSPDHGEIKVWDAANGDEVLTVRGHGKVVRPVPGSIAFSPDGQRLVTSCQDKTVLLWDAGTGTVLHILAGHEAVVHGVAYSPNGRHVASASDDRTVKIWDTVTGKAVTLRGHMREVAGVAYSRDGRRLASASDDRTVKIWDTATWREVLTLRSHLDRVYSVAFSPDGQRLASAGQEGVVRLWEAAPLTPEVQLGREAGALVNRLTAELLFKEDVLAHLQGDTTLDEPLRQKALSLADRYREQPGRFNQASLAMVRKPGASQAEYRLALRRAEKACRLLPDRCACFHTLAIAQFRLGQYREAIATLKKTEDFHARTKKGSDANDLAILAMSQYHLGQKDPAQATLRRLRQVMKLPNWGRNDGSRAFLAEAEALIEGKKREGGK
jgi:WD40 repeat protein